MKQGIAVSTQKTYNAAEKLFTTFCNKMGLPLFPASERTLIFFVTKLAQVREHSTIRVYLSGIRY